MEGLHSVIEPIRQPLADDALLAIRITLNRYRQVMEMLPRECPRSLWCAGGGADALSEFLGWLVRRDDQIALDGILGRELPMRQVLLVDDARVGNHESDL